MKKRSVVLGAVIAVVLAFCGCKKQQVQQVSQPQRVEQVKGTEIESLLDVHFSHADSLVLMPYKQADFERMLLLVCCRGAERAQNRRLSCCGLFGIARCEARHCMPASCHSCEGSF